MPRHPSMGPGYGGPANPTPRGPRAPAFTAQSQPAPEAKALGWATKPERDAAAHAMLGVIIGVAMTERDGKNDAMVVMAADKALNRLEGLPVARVITASLDDVPDDQLDARIAELQGRLGND